MPEEQIITNANDVTLTVSAPTGGDADVNATAGPDGRLVVNDFSLTHSVDLTSHSGIGRNAPKGISIGDIEYEWEFTVQGEDVDLFTGIVSDDGIPLEINMTAYMRDTQVGITGAFTEEDAIEGTSGDVAEMTFSGMATGMDRDSI